jgi:hypothetical protein
MNDEPDELELLRRANPVPSSHAPDDELAALAARIERITMETKQDVAGTRTTRWVAVAAAAVVAVVGVVGAVALSGDDDDAPEAAVTTTVPTTVDPAAGISQMCVETYDLTTLTQRDVAFDGTVQSVADDSVTFEVNEWFHGGDAASTTLEGANTIGGFTSAGASISLEPGTRMLVSGDDGFAWSCGFTMAYDESVADQWRDAFA